MLQQSEKSVTKLIFDRYGKIYPNLSIDNNLLKKNYSSLELYYKNNLEILKRDLEELDVEIDEPLSKKNSKLYFEKLQQKSFKDVISRINISDFDEITFLVHGFRNRYGYALSSYLNAENAITSAKPAINHHFVEVYWDGLTWTKYNAIKVWDNAQAHSYLVGLELRKVLSEVESESIKILAHSTGANLICTALFNQTSKMSRKDKKEFQTIYLDKLNNPSYLTPSTSVSVALIAPAIPGFSTFIDYDERNTSSDSSESDNYNLIISLNEYDPALTKGNFLGEAAIKTGFGSTSLGCLKEEQDKVKELFKKEFKTLNRPLFIDFSITSNNYRQNVHELAAYIKNPKFEQVLEELYK